MSDRQTSRFWTVRASRTVLKDRWINVRADDCLTPQGVALSPYYVLEYPEWVHVAAFDEEDRLVLVRQYRHGARAMSLELPGGIMDPQESDPLVTGARELKEETGYVTERLTHLVRLSPNPGTHANGVHLLLGTNARQLSAPAFDEGEDIAVEPTPWPRALEMAAAGEILHAPHVGLIFIALKRAGKI